MNVRTEYLIGGIWWYDRGNAGPEVDRSKAVARRLVEAVDGEWVVISERPI